MHNAPSVVYPVGRCRFYAGLLLALGVLALAVWLMACAPLVQTSAAPGPGPGAMGFLSAALGLMGWLGWAVFAAFSWLRSPVGQLQWDAQGSRSGTDAKGIWRWRSTAYQDGTPLQQVRLALDLQSRMLLCLRNTDAAHVWIWVEKTRAPPCWLDLRRALVATRA